MFCTGQKNSFIVDKQTITSLTNSPSCFVTFGFGFFKDRGETFFMEINS